MIGLWNHCENNAFWAPDMQIVKQGHCLHYPPRPPTFSPLLADARATPNGYLSRDARVAGSLINHSPPEIN